MRVHTQKDGEGGTKRGRKNKSGIKRERREGSKVVGQRTSGDKERTSGERGRTGVQGEKEIKVRVREDKARERDSGWEDIEREQEG